MNNFHEEKEDNKGKKTKLLFIHGEQRTVEHVNKAYNNVLSCIIMAIKEPEKAQLYKCVSEMIDVFQSERGIKLFRRMSDRYHFVHYMICDLHRLIYSHHEGACQPAFLSIMKSDADIPYQDSLGMAKSGFEFSKSNVWAAIGGNDTLYVNPPITWTLFSPRSPKKNYRWDDLDPSTTTENTATTVTKRQRTSTTTTNTRSNNTRATTNTQRE